MNHDDDPCRKTLELLLSSITQKMGDDGLLSSFFFGKPGSPLWDRRLGTEIYYHFRELTLAALYVRKKGPPYLRYLPLDSINSMLQHFISENFWYLSDTAWLNRFDGTFAENVPEDIKSRLAIEISRSPVFAPIDELTLYPLVPIQVSKPFKSNTFFLLSSEHFDEDVLPQALSLKQVNPKQFPPLHDWKGRKEKPSAWLGVRSPSEIASGKMKAAILGALALTPLPRYRHLFSGRAVFGGRCTISTTATTSFGDAHTPPLMHDIIVTQQDHAWLNQLSDLLATNDKKARRKLRALEYFYRAWDTEASERFPLICMALDAVFGDANRATQAVIDGVRETIGDHVSDARLRKLMYLRAAVIHGGAPDVYDSSKYAEYYEQYHTDPITDMELVVAACLRTAIFGDALNEHADPNAAIIAEQQSKGRLPSRVRYPSILDSDDSELTETS
jgi:hypothetical protein